MVQQPANSNINWAKELEAFQKKYRFVFDEDVLAETARIVYEKTRRDFKLTCKPSVFIYGVARKRQMHENREKWKKNQLLSELISKMPNESMANDTKEIEIDAALLESPEYFRRLYTRLNYFSILQRLDIPKERERLKMLIARKRDGKSWKDIFEEMEINRTPGAARTAVYELLGRLGRILPPPHYPIIEDILYGIKISINCPYIGLTIYDGLEYSLRQFFNSIDAILKKRVLFIGQCRGNRCSTMTLLVAQNYSWDIVIANEQAVKFPAAVKVKKEPIHTDNLEIALQVALRRLPHYGAIIVDSSVHGRYNNLSRALEDHKLLCKFLSPIITED
ncbi:MAG: hypothetical protein AAGG75_02025 [Bacteroidota bacterium]